MVIAKSPDDLLSVAQVTQMPRLEIMQGILEGRLPGPPIGAQLGYTLHEVSEGRAVFRGTPEFSMTNPMPSQLATSMPRAI